MKASIQHSVYGEITYDESFWTGRKNILVNKNPLQKLDKTTFVLPKEGGGFETVKIKGNFMIGAKATIGSETLTLMPTIKWYEIVLTVLIFLFNVVWANVPQLVLLMPLVGGFIGGFASAFIAFLGLFVMRLLKQVYWKLLVFVGFFGASILICWGIAMMILMMT